MDDTNHRLESGFPLWRGLLWEYCRRRVPWAYAGSVFAWEHHVRGSREPLTAR